MSLSPCTMLDSSSVPHLMAAVMAGSGGYRRKEKSGFSLARNRSVDCELAASDRLGPDLRFGLCVFQEFGRRVAARDEAQLIEPLLHEWVGKRRGDCPEYLVQD